MHANLQHRKCLIQSIAHFFEEILSFGWQFLLKWKSEKVVCHELHEFSPIFHLFKLARSFCHRLKGLDGLKKSVRIF